MDKSKFNNFYLIEVKNDALSALFKNNYGLSFFAVASDEFATEIEAINAADNAVSKMLSDIKTTVSVEQKFSPIAFPTLDKKFQLDEIVEGIYDNVHPNTIVKTTAKINDSLLIASRVISNNPITDNTSIQ